MVFSKKKDKQIEKNNSKILSFTLALNAEFFGKTIMIFLKIGNL